MIFTLALRHLKLYFRDKATVFFSLLSVFIIIGLYVLFLGDLVSNDEIEGYRTMMDQWIMAGVIAVSGFTTTLGAYGILVDDKAKKLERDFVVSPISPTIRVLGHALGSVIIGLFMSIVTLVFAQIYILIYGGPLLDIIVLIKLIGLMLLNVLTASSIIFFIILFIKTTNAFSIISTIVGTLIGFLMGIYVPIGNLPDPVKIVIMLFPPSHSGVLFRSVMMEESMGKVFANAPIEELTNLQEFLGVKYFINGNVLPNFVSLLVLIATLIVFFIASVLTLRFKKQK